MASSSDLIVRRHDRYACDFGARVRVAPSHQTVVCPARSVADSDGAVAARVVDCSLGGIGLRSAVFLPLSCRLRVAFVTAHGSIEADVRVQRAAMIDRKPTYYLGTSFDGASPDAPDTVAALVAALRESGAALVPEKSGA